MARSSEIRDRDEAEVWLGAGLCLGRLGADVATVTPWLVATVSESGSLPPAGVVADIGALASGKAFELGKPIDGGDARLRAAVRSYEEQVLGRLSVDARLEAVIDAIAKLPADLKKDAVALVVGRFVERTGFGAGVAMSPAVVRRLTKRSSAELSAAGYAGLRGPAGEALAAGYEELVRGARATGTLIGDAEVFALENLTVLGSLNQRVAVEQMVAVAEELESALPRRLRKRGPQHGAVHTQVEDESTYPIGGFSSMSTAGSMENLVCSELIYMEDTPAGDDSVDLFDMRYTEQELLYYTRDESVFVRGRRVITFAILPDLVEARFKDAGSRWQRIVIVFGAILCAVRRLTDWLSEEGLLFRILFVADGPRKSPLGEEMALSSLLLREWIEKGVAEVAEAPTLEAVMADASERARRAQCQVIAVGTESPFDLKKKGETRVRRGALVVAGASPRLELDGMPPALPSDEVPDGFRAWVQAALDLLQEVGVTEQTRLALEDAIRADPSDLSARAVYADFLQAAGDPLGLLMQIEIERQKKPITQRRFEELTQARTACFAEHRRRFLGDLDDQESKVKIGWWCGAITSARFDSGDAPELLTTLLARPAARLLLNLSFAAEPASWQALCDTLVAADPMPPLRGLDLDHTLPLEADLSAIWPRVPRLRFFSAHLGNARIGALDLREATAVRLRSSSFGRQNLVAVTTATWPRLANLNLQLGAAEARPWELDAFDSLLIGVRFPALEALTLHGLREGDAFVRALAASPLAPKLKLLHLGKCAVTDAGAGALAAARDRFERLETLGLWGNAIGGRHRETLREMGCEDLPD